MSDPLLARKFERMGARLHLAPLDQGEIRLDGQPAPEGLEARPGRVLRG